MGCDRPIAGLKGTEIVVQVFMVDVVILEKCDGSRRRPWISGQDKRRHILFNLPDQIIRQRRDHGLDCSSVGGSQPAVKHRDQHHR